MVLEQIKKMFPVIEDLEARHKIASIKLTMDGGSVGESVFEIELDFPWSEISKEELEKIAQRIEAPSIRVSPCEQRGLKLKATIDYSSEK